MLNQKIQFSDFFLFNIVTCHYARYTTMLNHNTQFLIFNWYGKSLYKSGVSIARHYVKSKYSFSLRYVKFVMPLNLSPIWESNWTTRHAGELVGTRDRKENNIVFDFTGFLLLLCIIHYNSFVSYKFELDIYNWFQRNLICIIAHASVIIHWYLFEQTWKKSYFQDKLHYWIILKVHQQLDSGGSSWDDSPYNRIPRLSVHLSLDNLHLSENSTYVFKIPSVSFSTWVSAFTLILVTHLILKLAYLPRHVCKTLAPESGVNIINCAPLKWMNYLLKMYPCFYTKVTQ